jgi:hypothetical protein
MVLVVDGKIDPQEDYICIHCASKRITELSTQLAAERKAVSVLGEYAYWQDTDNAVRHLTSHTKIDNVNKKIHETWRAVFVNPIAAAAIKAAADAGLRGRHEPRRDKRTGGRQGN